MIYFIYGFIANILAIFSEEAVSDDEMASLLLIIVKIAILGGMKILFLILCWTCLFAPENLRCQLFSKQDLVADLSFLNEAVKHGHPVNYLRKEKIAFDSLVEAVILHYPDSISSRLYESTVRQAVWEIGCAHTYVTVPTVRSKAKVSELFPLKVFTDGIGLFLLETPTDTLSAFKKGQKLETINGITSTQIIRDLSKYQSPDGKSTAFANLVITQSFRALFYIYYGHFPSFHITVSDEGKMIQETWKPVKPEKSIIPPIEGKGTILITDSSSYFGLVEDSIAYLQINTFSRNYKWFYKKVFRYMEAAKPAHLVIDLRGNSGGSRNNTEALLSYLLHEKAEYSVIRPKANLGKYLEGKHRRRFLSSYIYFDLGDLFKRRKVKEGTAFRYRIKPRKMESHPELYVLINGYSASASTIVASYLKHHAHAVMIGQQSGGGEFTNNGGSYPSLVLPRSKIEIKTATYHFQYDFEGTNKAGIIPDHVINYDVHSYRTTDLEMLKVLELIGQKK